MILVPCPDPPDWVLLMAQRGSLLETCPGRKAPVIFTWKSPGRFCLLSGDSSQPGLPNNEAQGCPAPHAPELPWGSSEARPHLHLPYSCFTHTFTGFTCEHSLATACPRSQLRLGFWATQSKTPLCHPSHCKQNSL